jgi:anti-sigma regulatory factor (Ser/Thr protein kinase)
VRQLLAGVADGVGLDEPVLDDVRTAVSEACNNVVLHAYAGDEGPLEVDVRIEEGEVRVSVRDQGEGIQPRPIDTTVEVQGVGLSLITALTDRVEFLGGSGEGTEVRMAFASPVDREMFPDGDNDRPYPPLSGEPGDVQVSVCEGPLSGPVLSSLVAGMAARAGLSVERVTEAQLLSDTISAHAYRLILGRHVNVSISLDDGRLSMSIGTLRPDGARELVGASALPGLGDGPLLERLAADISIEPEADGERLSLSLPA